MKQKQFRIRSLFVLTALLACWIGYATTAGIVNSFFWFTALVAFAFSGLLLLPRETTRAYWVCVSGILLLCSVFLFAAINALALMGVAIIHFLTGITCVQTPWSRPRTLVATLSCTTLVFGILNIVTLGNVREIQQLLRDYPIESLEKRLDYESARTPSESLALGDTVTASLRQQEEDLDGTSYHRVRTLRSLHERKTLHFAVAQGFGPVRMPPLRAQRIELPPLIDIAFDETVRKGDRILLDDLWTASGLVSDEMGLVGVHRSGVYDFVDPSGYGYVASKAHAAGFTSHAFHRPISPRTSDRYNAAPTVAYAIERLELVSILKNNPPTAYVTDHLPRMDQLSSADFPVRSLDRFELRALQQLRSDEDLVIQETKDRIRMVGSLRATEQCLQCHSVLRGELLGAFTYLIAKSSTH